MKKLSQLIIRSFLGPFILTFVLVLFILLMQFVWKYLDDIMGKGLEWTIIAKFILFWSTNLVSLALPLAVLLSSIMTFGNLAEHYELVALKSSGLSLLKIMRPLIIFVVLISIGAFVFSNEITPYANLKSRSLLHDIKYHRPMMEVKDGVFYNRMPGFSLRISDNDEKTGKLSDVLIYDHRNVEAGNSKVIKAESGRMDKTASGRYLILSLFNGRSYDEQGSGRKMAPNMAHVSSTFEEMQLKIDISALEFKESDEERWKNNIPMQNMSQLETTADSLSAQRKRRIENLDKYLLKAYHLTRDSVVESSDEASSIIDYIYSLDDAKQRRVMRIAYNLSNNSSSYLSTSLKDINNRYLFINRHWIEWHRKFTLSFACLLFFFIGAPLGAIIKKGGLGSPVIFSVIFFLIFHITSISGEKMVKSGSLEPFSGMWLSTFVLLPIALFLTIKAARDSALFDRTAYQRFFNRAFRGTGHETHENTPDMS